MAHISLRCEPPQVEYGSPVRTLAIPLAGIRSDLFAPETNTTAKRYLTAFRHGPSLRRLAQVTLAEAAGGG